MSYKNTRGAIGQYASVKNAAGIEEASPHRLIQMLMEGALEKIAQAKGFMEGGDIPNKGRHISWAISIIDGLRISLDKDAGGDIAENLDSLYEYMTRRLVEANLRNDKSILEEVSGLIIEIKSAWDAIPEDVRKQARQPVEEGAQDKVSVIG